MCPPALVDRVLAEHGRQECRCRLLPARLVVYALLLMCIAADLSYAKLMHHLQSLAPASGGWQAAHKSAFVRARHRLGWELLEGLFRVCRSRKRIVRVTRRPMTSSIGRGHLLLLPVTP